MAGNIVELTDETFESTVNGSEPVLVDFWAPWCAPCKMLTPVIEEMAEEYAGKAAICKVDIDEHRNAALEYGVQNIPTIILFNGGQVVNKWVGLTAKQEMTAAIDELL